jgi:hypothetical protein
MAKKAAKKSTSKPVQKVVKPQVQDRHLFLAVLVVAMVMITVLAYMKGVGDAWSVVPAEFLF